MNLEIKFTPKAEETYEAVVLQLRERWGDRFVKKFENKISKIFDTISTTPYIYPTDRKFTDLRKCIPHKNCSMFYKINDDHILIAYFWDNRQDPLVIH
ncbi:type II toxin-antitoxin system RelE/ParE family toxin [Mucilaginibacter sp.]|uniref:type II toxin-antitoxin system RelE/ParE family toxin n=1 Tax=Mucilaginibacter sp. TaxID=1882438 RepID=UPI00261F01D2|nr:type II toxin-antitoxin system RelE/ParE family toxin [Mucilaginibacter sp.]MDB4927427.1 Plasmid stabilization system protein ParE [Mucilaginibacter sp.]